MKPSIGPFKDLAPDLSTKTRAILITQKSITFSRHAISASIYPIEEHAAPKSIHEDTLF